MRSFKLPVCIRARNVETDNSPRFGLEILLPFALSMLVLSCTCSNVFAQSTNTRVTGTVKDSADAVVSGARVTLVDSGSKEEKTVTSNEEGSFTFTNVRPGTYLVLAEATGFKRTQVQNVVVHVDTPAVLSLILEAGGISEMVSVTASDSQSLIRLEDAKLSTVIDFR